MASRMYMRRSHEKKRPSLQPDTFVPPNKSGATSVGSDSSSSLYLPTAENERNRRQSFPSDFLDSNGSDGSTPTSGGSDRFSSTGDSPDAPLVGLKNLKAMDTTTRRLINPRFRILCFGLTAILLVVVFLSLYRLLL